MDGQSADASGYHATTAEHDAVDGSARTRTDQAARNTALSDSHLMVRIGQRDQQALEQLYDHYGALIYTIALRLTHDQVVAEIVAHDVFYAVWQSASSFQLGTSVPAWLMEMARQRSMDAMQLRGSRSPRPVATHKALHFIRRDDQCAGSAYALNLHNALDGLPADQRDG